MSNKPKKEMRLQPYKRTAKEQKHFSEIRKEAKEKQLDKLLAKMKKSKS